MNVLWCNKTWYAMCLCHACTSTPIHAIESGGPALSSPRSFIEAEKLLEDSWSIQTRQFTLLNLTSLVKDLLDSEFSSETLWPEPATHEDDDVDESTPRRNADVDACLNWSWLCRTLILVRWGKQVLMFNLSSDSKVFLQYK